MHSTINIGLADTRQGPKAFGLSLSDRLNHQYIIGQTGTGKSTLIANMALQDAASSNGFCLIDPHGDLASDLASTLNKDVMLWRVGDPASPYGYNPLARVPPNMRPLVASGLIETLKMQWSDSWGPRMEHLLRQAVLTLLDQTQAQMSDIVQLFVDRHFREQAITHIVDPYLIMFWRNEFAKMNYLSTLDGVAPIANKLSAFLADPIVRRSVCEPETPLRFRRIMDQGQILIVDLGKGRVGADVSNVIGGMIVTSIFNAALSRQSIPHTERRPFFLYMDEFHNFTTSSVANLLSEARKYGLGMCAAHQFLTQTDGKVLDAVIGNVGTLISMRIGAKDAPLIARQFGHIDPRYFTDLPNYRGFAQIMQAGSKKRPFSFRTTNPVTNL